MALINQQLSPMVQLLTLMDYCDDRKAWLECEYSDEYSDEYVK